MRDTNQVGLHIRLTHTLTDLAQKAARLGVKHFQSFFVFQSTGFMIKPTHADINSFLTLRRKHFDKVYLHGSYWINLAGIKNQGLHALQQELALAKKLEFTHIILHPGSAKGAVNRQAGIDNLACSLNIVLKKEKDIQIVLENTAHGKKSMGGDLQEFKLLLEKLDQPDKLKFCIDTAHAHGFGYDLSNVQKQEDFIREVEATIGFERVALIHLNDTQEKCGSKIDRHAIVGQGTIGLQALQQFISNPSVKSIPVIMELPVIDEQAEKEALKIVDTWYT